MPHLDLGDGFRLYYEVHGPALDAPGVASSLAPGSACGNTTAVQYQRPAVFHGFEGA